MNWSNKLVLIAEDEEANFMLLEEILEESEIKIVRAKNGEEAIELFKENLPDVVLMDIKMPKLTGYEATAKIREINSTVPIIAQTAYIFESDRKRILTEGFTDYISKPIEEEALLSVLQKYLGE